MPYPTRPAAQSEALAVVDRLTRILGSWVIIPKQKRIYVADNCVLLSCVYRERPYSGSITLPSCIKKST